MADLLSRHIVDEVDAVDAVDELVYGLGYEEYGSRNSGNKSWSQGKWTKEHIEI